MNGFLRSNLVSPTPQARDLAPRHFQARDMSSSLRPESFPPGMSTRRGKAIIESRSLIQLAYSYTNSGSFGHIEASYAMKDATIYNASSRLPFVPTNYGQFREPGTDHLRSAASYGFQRKQEEYSGSHIGDPTQGTNSPFTGMSGTNPLFSNDRSFINMYDPAAMNATFSPLSFSPSNRQQDHAHTGQDTKQRTHICEAMDPNGLDDEPELSLSGSWSLPGADNDLGFPHGLTVDDPQI